MCVYVRKRERERERNKIESFVLLYSLLEKNVQIKNHFVNAEVESLFHLMN